jgi:hypothetical protein
MELCLPELKGVTPGLRKGRNIYEGYQRGWGLQFGGLREKILNDPLYTEALSVARDRTIMSEENMMNIFLLLRFFLGKVPSGNIVEYGSYQGGSAIFMAWIAKRLYSGVKVFALDTFAGMPQTDKGVDAHNAGDFSNVDYEKLKKRVKDLQLDNLVLVKGLFENTHPSAMDQAGQVVMAHIDCDIYSAVQFCYQAVKPYMVDGGYVVFDDATVSSCIGATEAVEESVIQQDGLHSEQIWPHYVFRIYKE